MANGASARLFYGRLADVRDVPCGFSWSCIAKCVARSGAFLLSVHAVDEDKTQKII